MGPRGSPACWYLTYPWSGFAPPELDETLAALEATRGSFDDAAAAVERATGQAVGKPLLEALAARVAADSDALYASASTSGRRV